MKFNTLLKNLKKSEVAYSKLLQENIKQLNTALYIEIVKAKEELLKTICEDENLNYDELNVRYIKSLKKDIKKKCSNLELILDSDSSSSDEESENNNDLCKQDKKNTKESIPLEKHKIKNKLCYVENIEGGSIFNSNVVKIGEVKEGSFLLYEK